MQLSRPAALATHKVMLMQQCQFIMC